MAVFLAEGQAGAEQLQAGDVGYAPMGAGHYIRNTEPTLLKVLIGFNNRHYLANDLSAWMATKPLDVFAINLGLPRAVVERMRIGRASWFRCTESSSERLTCPGF